MAIFSPGADPVSPIKLFLKATVLVHITKETARYLITPEEQVGQWDTSRPGEEESLLKEMQWRRSKTSRSYQKAKSQLPPYLAILLVGGVPQGGPREFNHITQSFIATELDLASHIMLKKICNLVVNIMKTAKKGFYIIDSGAGLS